MGLTWWQYAVALVAVALVWFVVEMVRYMVTDPGAPTSTSARLLRIAISIAIFAVLFGIAWWLRPLIFS